MFCSNYLARTYTYFMTEGRFIGVAVVTSGAGVLVVKREDGITFPAAEIMVGEPVADTIARTVPQQTGIAVTPGKLLGARKHPRSGLTTLYVSASPEALGVPNLPEAAYVPLGEALRVMPDMPPQARCHLETALGREAGLSWVLCR